MSLHSTSLTITSPKLGSKLGNSPIMRKKNLNIDTSLSTNSKKHKLPPKTSSKSEQTKELMEEIEFYQEIAEDAEKEADMRSEGYESLLEKEREKTAQIGEQFKSKEVAMEEKVHEAEMQLERAQMQLNENINQLSEKDTAIKSLAKQRDEQEKQAEQLELNLQEADQLLSQTEELKEQTVLLTKDNQVLSQTLEKCEGQLKLNDDKIAKLNDHIGLEQKENNILEQKVETYALAVKQAKEKIIERNREISSLTSTIEKQTEYIQKAKEIIRDKNQLIAKQKEDNAIICENLETLNEKSELEEVSINNLNEQLEEEKNQLLSKYKQELKLELDEEKDEYERQMQQEEEKAELLQQHIQEGQVNEEDLQKEADEQQSKAQMLQLEINQKQSEIIVLNQKIDELRIRNATKDKLLDDTEEKINKITLNVQNEATNDKSVELEQQLIELKSINDDLKSRLKAAISETDDEELSASQETIETLRDLSDKNSELQSNNMNIRIENEKFKAEISRLEKENARLTNEQQKLTHEFKEEMFEEEQNQDAIYELKKELTQSLDSIEQYEINFANIEGTLLKNDTDGSIELLINQYRGEADNLSQEVEMLKNELSATKTQNNDKKAEILAKEQEIEQLESKADALEQENKQLLTSNQNSTTQIIDFEQQLNILEEFKSKHTDCDIIKEQNNEMSQNIEELRAQLMALEDYRETQKKYVAFSDKEELQFSELSTVPENMLQEEQRVQQSIELSTNNTDATCSEGICKHAEQNEMLQKMLHEIEEKYFELQRQIENQEVLNTENSNNNVSNASMADQDMLHKEQQDLLEQINKNRHIYEEEIAELNDEIAILMTENQSFKSQQPQLENDLEQSRYKIEQNEDDLLLKNEILSQMQSEKAILDTKYQKLQEDNNKLINVNNQLQRELKQAMDKLSADELVVDSFEVKLKQMNELETVNEKLELLAEKHKYEIQTLQEDLEQQKALSEEAKKNEILIQQKQQEVLNLHEQIDNLRLDLQTSEQLLNTANANGKEYEIKIKDLQAQLLASQQTIQDEKSEILSINDLRVQVQELETAKQETKRLNEKLTEYELNNMSLLKKLTQIQDEKLKLQSSNILLISIHKSQIESNLRLNFKLDRENYDSLLKLLKLAKSWNLQPQEVQILCDRKFISNKQLQSFVCNFIKAQNSRDLNSSFAEDENFFTVQEIINYSDGLKLLLKRAGVDTPRGVFSDCVQIFRLVEILQNHFFVLKELADLLGLPADFSRESSLEKLNFGMILRDSTNQNLLSSCCVSDYIFFEQYKAAVLQKAKCEFKKCEAKICQIIREGVDLARMEHFISGETIYLERTGLLRDKQLFEGENLHEKLDFELYFAQIAWLLLMHECEVVEVEECSGFDEILNEGDDETYDLFYPGFKHEGQIVGKAIGKIIR